MSAHSIFCLLLALTTTASLATSDDDSAARLDAALQQTFLKSKAAEHRGSMPATQAIPPAPPSPPPLADDATFVRRVFIDLAGRLPTANEVRSFISSTQPDKRATLIDQLSATAYAADWRFLQLASTLRVQDQVLGKSQEPFIRWLREVVRKDMPWDEMVRTMLTATGDLETSPAGGLLMRDPGHPLTTAVFVAGALLGKDFQCAQCHDHPFNDNTQMQTYQLAACFNVASLVPANAKPAAPRRTLVPGATPFGPLKVPPPSDWSPVPSPSDVLQASHKLSIQGGPDTSPMPTKLPQDYKYRDGKPGELVFPHLVMLDHKRSVLNRQPAFSDSRPRFMRPDRRLTRKDIAEWVTETNRNRFAATMAMRIWLSMFGITGRHADTNEPAAADPRLHPWVLDCEYSPSSGIQLDDQVDNEFGLALANAFIEADMSLARFQRIIARTHAYQGESLKLLNASNSATLPYNGWTYNNNIPMTPLVRRIPAEVLWDSLVTWLPEQSRKELLQACIDLPQVPPSDHPLHLMGHGTRDWSDQQRAPVSRGLVRFMMNSPLITSMTDVHAPLLSEHSLADLFLSILGRPPTDIEGLAAAEQSPADIVWALLNTSEFLFQH